MLTTRKGGKWKSHFLPLQISDDKDGNSSISSLEESGESGEISTSGFE